MFCEEYIFTDLDIIVCCVIILGTKKQIRSLQATHVFRSRILSCFRL